MSCEAVIHFTSNREKIQMIGVSTKWERYLQNVPVPTAHFNAHSDSLILHIHQTFVLRAYAPLFIGQAIRALQSCPVAV